MWVWDTPGDKGHPRGQGTSCRGTGASQGMRDILLWIWGTLGDKGHLIMELGHPKGEGTRWSGSRTSRGTRDILLHGRVTLGCWGREGFGVTRVYPDLPAPQMVSRKSG